MESGKRLPSEKKKHAVVKIKLRKGRATRTRGPGEKGRQAGLQRVNL